MESIASAAEAVKRRRAAEQQQKIQRAQVAIQEWQKQNRREPWVARTAKLTTRWITSLLLNTEPDTE